MKENPANAIRMIDLLQRMKELWEKEDRQNG